MPGKGSHGYSRHDFTVTALPSTAAHGSAWWATGETGWTDELDVLQRRGGLRKGGAARCRTALRPDLTPA